MTFDWSEYLNLSRNLAGKSTNPSEEAKLRTAISRAYYAVFCKARDYLASKEPGNSHPAKSDIHYYVQSRFSSSRDKVRKDIGDHLLNLRTYRNRADYENEFRDLKNTAELAIRRAGQALHQIGQLK